MALVVLILLVLFPSVSNAQYAVATPPSGWSQATSGTFYRPPSAVAWNGTAFQAAARVQVAGKTITVPATLRFAANAPAYALPFVRSNPLLFVGTATAAWLLTDYLLDWIDPNWTVSAPDPLYIGEYSGTPNYSTMCALFPQFSTNRVFYSGDGPAGASFSLRHATHYNNPFPGGCPGENSNSTFSVTTCHDRPHIGGLLWQVVRCRGVAPQGSIRPATEADWQGITGTWPASALEPVARQSPLPVQAPEIAPFVEPLGNPYTDPITGQPWQDMVRITPDPTPESPWRLRLDPFRQPMTTTDPAQNPQVDPNISPETIEQPPTEPPPPFELPGFCDWATIVCDLADWFREEADDPEGVDLPELEPVDLSAQSFGLPTSGTCPAPMNLNIGLGAVQVKYDPFCDFATAVRPLVIATGWLAAVMILVGWRRS